ncbi:MAG: hypothetical protein ACREJO_06995 [Phycisphaerales bacterium]
MEQELGGDAAATVRAVGENDAGMSYMDWHLGPTPYHLGTCDEPYISITGVGKVGEPARWMMREEMPPEDERHAEAWMAHAAWMYVDALQMRSLGGGREHLGNVLRLASHFVDEATALVWLCGDEPKRVALPTAETVASLREGKWPDHQ